MNKIVKFGIKATLATIVFVALSGFAVQAKVAVAGLGSSVSLAHQP